MMGKRFKLPLYGFIFIASVLISGCPPVPSGKGKPATPSLSSGAGTKAGGSISSGSMSSGSMSSGRVEKSKDLSSLEAFRQGKEVSSGPMKDIHFQFDRSSLAEEARETLSGNAAWLKSHRSVRVEIEGHADERGTNEYNLALGSRRAQAAKDFLVSLGISNKRISTISYGEELPVCRDKAEACWQQNRRAHFVAVGM